MKALRRFLLRRRMAALQHELTCLDSERSSHQARVDHVLSAICAARWDLMRLDRPPITHAPGRPRLDGVVRQVSGLRP